MTYEKVARKIAKNITKGIIPPQHIGFKSFLVLKQEIFSLLNRYNPSTMSDFEKTVYAKDLASTVEGILQQTPKDQDILFREFSEFPDFSLQKRENIQQLVNESKKDLTSKAPYQN